MLLKEKLLYLLQVGFLTLLKQELPINKIHWLQTKRENNWFPTVKELENKIKNINKKNIILILNSPNNPSGAACGNLKKIAEVVKKHKVLVLSDEIYYRS